MIGKPLIDSNSAPKFEFSFDAYRGLDLDLLRNKIRMSDSIPSSVIGLQLENELVEIRDVSWLLQKLSVTASFLCHVGGGSKASLPDRMLELKIVAREDSLPKSLKYFKVEHLLALMIRLRFVRAKRMVLNNQWPFENAGKEFFEAIPKDLMAKAEAMLHHVRPG